MQKALFQLNFKAITLPHFRETVASQDFHVTYMYGISRGHVVAITVRHEASCFLGLTLVALTLGLHREAWPIGLT